MSIQRFKISLNNARFPFISEKAQRAVFYPALDSAPRTPRQFMGEIESIDYNLAQVIYGENIMPSAQGIKSVGFSSIISPTVNDDFDTVFALRDEDENTVLFSPGKGKNYIYDESAQQWTSTPIASIFPALTLCPTCDPTTSEITYAYVDGKTFVCYARLKSTTNDDMSILFWNPVTGALEPAGALIANLPFAAGEIDGISSSNGYLLVYSGIEIAYAPFNGTAFDFIPYANGAFTGAGRQIAEDIKGNIRAVISVPGGFIMFTDKNAVAANYHAQSIAAPWVFREVPACGGLESYQQASVEGTLGRIFAYTTAGMQSISLNSAESVWPDAADFIAGRKIERFRYALNELYSGQLTLDLFVKVANVGNRYIVISYGSYPGVFSYALVWDLALERWGKIRFRHRDAFYYAYGAEAKGLTYAALGDIPYSDPLGLSYSGTVVGNAFVSAQHGIAFLTENGEVVLADWSDGVRTTEDEGVAIIGRVQLTRARNVQFNRAEIEGLKSGEVLLQPSYDGHNLEAAVPLITITDTPNYKIVGGLVDGKNFNILIKGTFDLSTIILESAPSGNY